MHGVAAVQVEHPLLAGASQPGATAAAAAPDASGQAAGSTSAIASGGATPLVQAVPVATDEGFRLLCCSPPLQGSHVALPPFR